MGFNLTPIELLWLLPLAGLCIFTLVRNWYSTPLSIWSPMSLVSLLFLYYSVLGPLYWIYIGQTDFLGTDYRPLFAKGWAASFVAFLAISGGYLCYRGKKNYIGPVCTDELLQRFAIILVGITFSSMIVWSIALDATASMFNPFATAAVKDEMAQFTSNPWANYLMSFINLSIPALVLSLLVWLERRSSAAMVLFVFVAVFGISFFLSSGFRFRIVWMAIAGAAAYFLWKKRRPNLLIFTSAAIGFVLLMGFVGLTRNYWAGLDVGRAQGASTRDVAHAAFQESGIFFSLCSVLDAVPDKIPHTTWDPIWITITFPIPRLLWEGKPESETMRVLAESFGSKDAFDAGQAMPFFGEWYVAFGWAGLIISSFLLGLGSKRLWVWFLQRRDDKLVILIYTSCLGFLYFAYSRGYLPMIVQNFVFGVLPFFLLYGWLRRRALMVFVSQIFNQQQLAMAQKQRDRNSRPPIEPELDAPAPVVEPPPQPAATRKVFGADSQLLPEAWEKLPRGKSH